jgi:hypothetical protein
MKSSVKEECQQESLGDSDDEDFQPCLRCKESGATPENKLVLCCGHGCGVCYHQTCFEPRITDEDVVGAWYCSTCRLPQPMQKVVRGLEDAHDEHEESEWWGVEHRVPLPLSDVNVVAPLVDKNNRKDPNHICNYRSGDGKGKLRKWYPYSLGSLYIDGLELIPRKRGKYHVEDKRPERMPM